MQKASLSAVRMLLLSDSESAEFVKNKLKRCIKKCKNFDLLLENPTDSTSYTNYAMHRIIWYLDVMSSGIKLEAHWRYYLVSEETLREFVKALKHEPYMPVTIPDESLACKLINDTYKRAAATYMLNKS